MLLKLIKIPVFPLVLMFTIFQATLGLFLGVVVALGAYFGQETEGLWSLGVWAILVLPAANAVLGLAAGVFIAGFYNIIVQWLDRGVELEFDRQDNVSLK